MKKQILFFILFLACCMFSCKKDKEISPPTELVTIKANVKASLYILDNSLVNSAAFVAQNGIDSTLIRNTLIQLFSGTFYLKGSSII